MNRSLAGILSGFVATGPMTGVMELMHRALPSRQRYPLPPRTGTMQIAQAAGVVEELDESARTATTFAAHFATGGILGLIYSLVYKKLPPCPVLKGLAFGTVSWFFNYQILLPALGLMKPASRHPLQRNVLMIVAHLVWGLVTAMLMDRLDQETADRETPKETTD